MIPHNVIITRSWIMSRRAKNVYLICAILTLAMLGAIIVIDVAASIFGRTLMEKSHVVRFIAIIIVFPGVLATGTIWVAMGYHWYGYNNAGLLSKAFWFLCLFCLGPLAAVFYYFFPYRRSFALSSSETACESSNL